MGAAKADSAMRFLAMFWQQAPTTLQILFASDHPGVVTTALQQHIRAVGLLEVGFLQWRAVHGHIFDLVQLLHTQARSKVSHQWRQTLRALV